MINFSTREAAKRLGLSHNALAQYIRVGKVPAPRSITSGGAIVHIWTEDEIERVREMLPKIANGRKTRYQKKKSAGSLRKSAKPGKKKKSKKT
jgi:RNA recognition motif-containing protein